MNHQRLSQVHMASHGPNKTLLIFKDPGLGKTCDAIGIAETRHEWIGQVLDDKSTIKKSKLGRALIISQNTATQNDSFKSDIMDTCTAGAYYTEALRRGNYEHAASKLRSETISIQKNYELGTHDGFSRMISTMSDADISREYSFRPIFIDEIQNYRSKTSTVTDPQTQQQYVNYDKDITRATMRLIDNVYGSLIIIISATPTIDNVNEFPSILNFILPKNERISPSEWQYMTAGDDLDFLRRQLEDYLIPKLRGRVSRMKISDQIKKSIVRTNQSIVGHPLMKYSNKELWLSVISNQNDDYIDYTYLINAYRDNMENTNIYQNAIYASTMVWPNGYVKGSIKQFLTMENNRYVFTPLFIQDFYDSIQESRRYLVEELKKSLVILNAQQAAAPTEERQQDIESKAETMREYERRMNWFKPPAQPFNIDEDDDIRILLYTIRRRYSPVLADMIQQIIGIEYFDPDTRRYEYFATAETNSFSQIAFQESDKDNRECIYIYNERKPRGIAVACLFLEFFGYVPFPSSGTFIDKTGQLSATLPRQKRYALLYSSDDRAVVTTVKEKTDARMSDARIRSILEVANHPENKYGHYLKVVAGTEITAQGLNFLNIRQAHLLSREWNEGTNIQTEGRVDRPGGSHEAFDDSDPIPIFNFYDIQIPYNVQQMARGRTQKYVKIYRHVAYYPDINAMDQNRGESRNQSIGLRMYDDAAFKYRKNIIPLDIASRVSYDYVLNLRQGEVPKDDQFAVSGGVPPPIGTDYTNYNLFYARKEIDMIKCRIRGFFKVYFDLSVVQIVELLSADDAGVHQSTVIKALTEMVNDNERIIDRHGCLNYIREAGDNIFVQKLPFTVASRADQWLSFYSMHSLISDKVGLMTIYTLLDRMESEALLNDLLAEKSAEAMTIKLRKLGNRAKEYLIETIITRYKEFISSGKITAQNLQSLLDQLHPDLIYLNGRKIIIHTFRVRAKKELQSGGKSSANVIPDNQRDRLRIFQLGENRWRFAGMAEGILFAPALNSHISGVIGARIQTLNHWGTSVLDNGRHIFKVQDRERMAASSSKTLKNAESKKSAGIDGQNVITLQKPIQLFYLWGLQIDLFVGVYLYGTVNDPVFGPVRPIVLIRLQRDPNGPFNYGPVKLNYYLDKSNGEPHISTNYNDWKKYPNLVRNREMIVVNYKNVYPEILPWILDTEVQQSDWKLFTHPLFLPVRSPTSAIFEMPRSDRYDNIIDVLPDYGVVDIPTAIYGKSGSVRGSITMAQADTRDIYISSSAISSYDQLYDNLASNNPLDVETITGYRPLRNNPIPHYVGRRFASVWNLTQNQMGLLIFVLYYFSGATTDGR